MVNCVIQAGSILNAEVPFPPTFLPELHKAECLTFVWRLLREKELRDSPNLQDYKSIPQNLETKYGSCFSNEEICPYNGTDITCNANEK